MELELEASQSLLKEQHSNAMHRRMATMDRIRQAFYWSERNETPQDTEDGGEAMIDVV